MPRQFAHGVQDRQGLFSSDDPIADLVGVHLIIFTCFAHLLRELKNDLSTTRGATSVVLTLKVLPIKSCTSKVVSCTLSMFQATGSVRPARAQAGPLMMDSEAGPQRHAHVDASPRRSPAARAATVLCKNAGQRAVFAALQPSQGEVDPVVLAARKTLANLDLEWTAFRTLREGNKA